MYYFGNEIIIQWLYLIKLIIYTYIHILKEKRKKEKKNKKRKLIKLCVVCKNFFLMF